MNLKGVRDQIHYLYSILKEDTLEVIEKTKQVFKRTSDLDKSRKRRLNIWVGVFFGVLSVLSFYLIMPLIGGMIGIIFTEVTPEGTTSPSTEALVGFIIIATALGGLTMWFATRLYQDGNQSKSANGTIKLAAKLFLFAALSLSLFMLLSPILPTIRESTGLYEEALKLITAASFIGGSISFVMALIMGLIYIWKL